MCPPRGPFKPQTRGQHPPKSVDGTDYSEPVTTGAGEPQVCVCEKLCGNGTFHGGWDGPLDRSRRASAGFPPRHCTRFCSFSNLTAFLHKVPLTVVSLPDMPAGHPLPLYTRIQSLHRQMFWCPKDPHQHLLPDSSRSH